MFGTGFVCAQDLSRLCLDCACLRLFMHAVFGLQGTKYSGVLLDHTCSLMGSVRGNEGGKDDAKDRRRHNS